MNIPNLHLLSCTAQEYLSPSSIKKTDSDAGAFPSRIELLSAASKVISLLMNPFTSHVLRALFVLLTPSISDDELLSTKSSVLRPKESAKHHARQGPKKSVLHNIQEGEDGATPHGIGDGKIIAATRRDAEGFCQDCWETLGSNGIWALAVNKVGCLSYFCCWKWRCRRDLKMRRVHRRAASLTDLLQPVVRQHDFSDVLSHTYKVCFAVK